MQTLLRLAEKIWMNDLGATVSPTEKIIYRAQKSALVWG